MTAIGPALSTREAHAYIGVCLTTLRKLIAARELAYIDKGGMHLFLLADLDAWLLRDRVPARAEVVAATREGMARQRLRKVGGR